MSESFKYTVTLKISSERKKETQVQCNRDLRTVKTALVPERRQKLQIHLKTIQTGQRIGSGFNIRTNYFNIIEETQR